MNKEELDLIKKLMKKVEAEEETIEKETVKEKAVEVGVDMDTMLTKMGDIVAKAVIQANGELSKTDSEIKEKFFNRKDGLTAIQYPEKLSELKGDEKIAVWFKSLIRKNDDMESARVFRALNEGSAGDGGYLVPEELKAEVWRILPDYSIMRKLARIIPMSTDSLRLNTLTAMPQAYWTSEYASKTTTSAEFGQIELTPYKLVCLLPVTDELVADANIQVVRFIVELFAERLGHQEDKAYFTGSGSGQPTGLMGSLSTSVNAGNAVSFDNVIDLIYKVPQAIRNSKKSAFVAPANVIKSLRKIKDSNNLYIWSPGDPNNGQPERLYGYALYEQNSLAHNEMVFGDFNYYIIGDRQQLTVRTTNEGGDAWRRDSTEIKAKIRVDGEVILTSAFAKMVSC